MAGGRPLEIEQELIEAFRQSGLASVYLVKVLPPALWRAAPPHGRGRHIAAIVAHMQSVRRMIARMGGARPGPPAPHRDTSPPQQKQEALRRAAEGLARAV